MVEIELFAYRDADKVLESKGLLQEVKSILLSVSKVNHNEIQELFRLWDWALESYIVKETTWRWNAVHRDIKIFDEILTVPILLVGLT